MENKVNLNDYPWLKNYKDIPYNLNYPKCSMIELVESTAKKYPKNIAYEYYGKETTYKQFISKIEQIAKSLKSLGVKQNDRVTICMPNTPEGILSVYAVNMIGAVANMVHPLSSENEIEYYLKLSHSKYLICIDLVCEKIMKIVSNTSVKKVIVASVSEEMNTLVSTLYWITQGHKVKNNKNAEDVMFWKDFIQLGSNYTGLYRNPNKYKEPAVILYSGGTTGKPKGIVLTNLNFNALAMQAHLMCDPSNEGDSILSIMPIFHGFGLGVCVHTPLVIGMKCILIPSFRADKFYELIKKYKPNFLVGVPTLFEALLKNKKIGKHDLKCVKCIVSGGDTMPSALKKRVDKFLLHHGSNAQVREGYGLTEGTAASCLTPSNCYKESTIGIPFPDMMYKIVKYGTVDKCNYDEIGEICISGPTVMMGYLDDIKETLNTLKYHHSDNKIWLHTGDLGSMDENGFVYFKQRAKRLIISSGYNIYPSYIEKVLNAHPDINSSCVVGIKHPYKQQVAKAIIVLNEGVKPTDAVKKSIEDHCKLNLAKYSLPYVYEFRNSIPKTLVGKVAYTKLENGEEKYDE